MSREQGSINWNEVIKKEARGKNGEDQGEVQEVRDKEKFYVPQNEVDSYDGEVSRFKVSEEDIRTKYSGDLSPSASAVPDSSTNNMKENAAKQKASESNIVPLMEENLNFSKREVTYKEATLIREPVIDTKTVEVPVTHEEIIVERRFPTEATTSR
jgi:stress response protein YsnF